MHEIGRHRKLSPEASIEDEIAQLRDLDLKALRCGTSLASCSPNISPAISCFGSSPTGSRPIVLVISMPRP